MHKDTSSYVPLNIQYELLQNPRLHSQHQQMSVAVGLVA